jgi:hypothetical protein
MREMTEIERYAPFVSRSPLRKPIAYAIKDIEKRMSIGAAEAWVKLRDALSAGELNLTAYWAGNAVASGRWPGATIELGTVTLADGTRMAGVELSNYNAWLGTIAAPAPPRKKGKGGRPPVHDWDDYKQYFLQLWEKHSDFREHENKVSGWSSRADAAKSLLSYIDKRVGPDEAPVQETVEKRVDQWLAEIDSRAERN